MKWRRHSRTRVAYPRTRKYTNSVGSVTSTCIDPIFTNAAELCYKAISVPIGSSDHNIVAITMTAKVAKAGPTIIYQRSYKLFSRDSFVDDVKHVCWSDVFKEENSDPTLGTICKIILHALAKKLTVRTTVSPLD